MSVPSSPPDRKSDHGYAGLSDARGFCSVARKRLHNRRVRSTHPRSDSFWVPIEPHETDDLGGERLTRRP
jgi:hypothetical protein